MKKIEMVTWKDSVGASPGWEPVTYIHPAHVCKSVWFVIQEGPDVLVLAPHYSEMNPSLGMESDVMCGTMVIPLCSIVKRIRLRLAPAKDNDGDKVKVQGNTFTNDPDDDPISLKASN